MIKGVFNNKAVEWQIRHGGDPTNKQAAQEGIEDKTVKQVLIAKSGNDQGNGLGGPASNYIPRASKLKDLFLDVKLFDTNKKHEKRYWSNEQSTICELR